MGERAGSDRSILRIREVFTASGAAAEQGTLVSVSGHHLLVRMDDGRTTRFWAPEAQGIAAWTRRAVARGEGVLVLVDECHGYLALPVGPSARPGRSGSLRLVGRAVRPRQNCTAEIATNAPGVVARIYSIRATESDSPVDPSIATSA